MKGFFSKIFRVRGMKHPEDRYVLTMTNDFLKLEIANESTLIKWEDIIKIHMVNVDKGPFLIDIWVVLTTKNDKIVFPHGAKGDNQVFERITKFDGFNKDNFINSMKCTDNEEFILWTKPF